MRKAAIVLALFALLAGSVPATAGVPAGQFPGDAADRQPYGQVGVDPDPQTTITIHPQRDTDARFTVTTRYELDTPNETRAFETVAGEFEAGELDTGFDAALFRNIANVTATHTGRDMRVTNVTRRSNVSEGTLTLTFMWTNFLERTDDETLRLGDALRTPGNGTWLSSLDEGQRLVIKNPPGYTVPTSNYQIHNNTLVFEGPYNFRKRPSVVYEQSSTPEPPQQDPPWMLLTGGIVLAAVIVAAAFLARRRGAEPADESGSGANAATEPSVPGDDFGPQEAAGNGTEGGTAGQSEPAVEGAAADAVEGEETGVDLELLSDEERVEHLLQRSGGRMRQANIVKETGWSDAKVSQLLSSMSDEGRVEKLRLGRENLISLPDEENDES